MPPRLVLFLTAIALATALGPLRAQQSGVRDSTMSADSTVPRVAADSGRQPAGPTVAAARTGAARAQAPRRRDRLPVIFYGALAGAATTAAVLHVDPDSGGYRDGWTTATDFPDKAVHALAAWALTNVGVDLGARPRYAALAVCAAGTAFEFAQGYASPYDIAADCAGATGAALWQSWRARRRARRAADSASDR